MILTVPELRSYITTEKSDKVLEALLLALEQTVRTHTHNNFQNRSFRSVASAISDSNTIIFNAVSIPFKVGDTLEISDSDYQNHNLVTVKKIIGNNLIVNEPLIDESGIIITKIVYPFDVKLGVVNLIKWDLDNREKVGVQSETISRHSVTYFNMDGDNSIKGYPRSLMGFLNPYIKPYFGKGI